MKQQYSALCIVMYTDDKHHSAVHLYKFIGFLSFQVYFDTIHGMSELMTDPHALIVFSVLPGSWNNSVHVNARGLLLSFYRTFCQI
jgi:hypothetical protein